MIPGRGVTRRELCRAAAGFCAAGLTLACRDGSVGEDAGSSSWPAPIDGWISLSLAEFPELGEPDGWSRGNPPGVGHAIIVIHTEAVITAEAYVALTAACTHIGCGVNYRPAEALLVCPCHGSRFDLGGQVVHGPARTPLESYPVEVDAIASVIRIKVA